MNATVHNLDPKCVEYLQEVEYTSGRSAAGAFVRRRGLRAGPRSNWGLMLVLGLLLSGAAAAPLLSPGSVLTLNNRNWMPVAQGVVAGLGALLVFVGIVRFLRKPLAVEFGSFLFADGTTLWEVNRDRIDSWPLAELTKMDGRVTHSQNGVSITLSLVFDGRHWHRSFDTQQDAQRMLSFLSAQHNLRQADDADVRLMATLQPGRFAAIAEALATRSGSGELNIREENPDPPAPATVDGATAPTGGGLGVFVRLALAAGVAVGAVFGYRMADAFVLDGHSFEVAERTAKASDSPVALRDYLTDANNTRFRDQARTQIAVFYDRAIADLKQRAASKNGDIDPEMFEAVIALIEGMKTADRPVVTVGFKGTIDPLPTTAGGRELEQLEYDASLAQSAELKGVAARHGGKNGAILTHGEAFEPSQRERRERLILKHLQEALDKVAKKEVLAAEAAKTGEKPVLEVGYHIEPSGTLYTYTTPNEFGLGKTTNGLLRGYKVGWAITVTPPGGKPSVWNLNSQPLTSLRYTQETGDPAWAPYAILLYSAFHDMSGRLVKNFAVTPPPAPNVYTYAAVATSQSDVGLPGLDPFKFPVRDPFKLPKAKMPWDK